MSTRDIFDFNPTSHFTLEEMIQIRELRERWGNDMGLLNTNPELYKKLRKFETDCEKHKELVF